jgi:hypothetical protein
MGKKYYKQDDGSISESQEEADLPESSVPKVETPKSAKAKPAAKARIRNIPTLTSFKTITFRGWFIGLLTKDSRIRVHRYDEILVFFKGLGLSEEEPVASYNNALNLYFGSK